MSIDIKKLKPMDIILTGHNSPVYLFMKFIQRDPVRFSHAMIVIDSQNVIESNIPKIRITPIEDAIKNKNFIVLRYNNLTDKHIKVMTKSVMSLLGLRYSYYRICLMALDQILGIRYFSKKVDNKQHQVCSTFVAWCYYVATKIQFNGKHWSECDPDDIDDHIKQESKQYLVIGEEL